MLRKIFSKTLCKTPKSLIDQAFRKGTVKDFSQNHSNSLVVNI